MTAALDQTDETHAPGLKSFVESAEGHADFPIQNLPVGVFRLTPAGAPRGGVAIGEMVLDLEAALGAGLFEDEALAGAVQAARAPLNDFFALGSGPRRALRRRLSALLARGSHAEELLRPMLHPQSQVLFDLPAIIGDYTDFYAGIHHAEHVGRLFRPDQPLLPNYKHLPIGYHGRASSIRPTGTSIRRPKGQSKPAGSDQPSFGPSRRLDFELELGLWIAGGNALGETVPVEAAGDHIAGYCLLNDWSARDVQAFEYQPLGPFLAKSFATTISPWVVTPEALAPFRASPMQRAPGDPPLPAHLHDSWDQMVGALDIDLTVLLSTAEMRRQGFAPLQIGRSNTGYLYWSPAQMVAHHASNGCNLRPGDLLGTGTISGPGPGESGSLLEATNGGREPIRLPSGEERRFLEDGDEVSLVARCRKEGFVPIGFGPCIGRIEPAA